MFCTACGNEVEEHARFCSRCGHEVTMSGAGAAPVRPKKTARDMDMHITILGWLLIGSGILTAIAGMILVFVGQIFGRLPIPIERQMPMGVPPLAAWFLSVIGLAVLALAAATAAAGVGLHQYRTWARVFAIVMAALMILHFPIGTAIAVYAFWVLFSEEGQKYYKSRSESTMTPSGT